MNILRVVEIVVVFFTAIGFVFAAYVFLDTAHARREALIRTELELRLNILERDIKRDAEARVYYKDIEYVRQLEPAEKNRKAYLETNLQRKYEEQRTIEARKSQLD